MNELPVILSLLFFITVGFTILYAFEFLKNKSLLEKLPYAYGLGIGTITYQMFIYSRSGLKWSVELLILPWIFLGVLTFLKKKKIIISNLQFKLKLNNLEKMLLFLIIVQVGYLTFEVLLRPLYAWDGWAIWILKGKMFYIDGFVNPKVYLILKEGYPFVISLAVSFVYIVIGKADDRVVLLLFYAFYLAISLHFFNAARTSVGRTKALLFTFLLMSLQNMIRHGGRYEAGYADLPLGFYIFTSSTLLLDYIKSKSYKLLILLGVFLAITRLIKDEGLVFCVIIQLILVYYTLIKTKNIKHSILPLLWLIPVIDWQGFKYINNVNYSLYSSLIPHWQRITSISKELIKEFFSVKNWNLLWITFFLAYAVNSISKVKQLSILYIIIFFQLTVYIYVFMISPYQPTIHIPNVIDRLFLHIAPLVMLTICLTFYSHET